VTTELKGDKLWKSLKKFPEQDELTMVVLFIKTVENVQQYSLRTVFKKAFANHSQFAGEM